MKNKYLIFISILLIVLLGLGTVSASENVSGVDMTLGDSNSESAIPVDNWVDLKSYCESTNDQIICLNGSFSIDSQIEIKNNINIIGDADYYIGGTADSVNTYSSVPFLCSDALNVTFTNVNFQYAGGKYLMQFSGNGNYKLENCNFLNMDSGNDKSIIYSNYGVVNITDCDFTNCTVKTGVIYNYYAANSATANNARLYVTDSRFKNNYASSHSGAIANSGYLVVDNTTFDSNYAKTWAGAIHTAAYANTTIYDSTFCDNLADWNGGALYTYSNLQIYNCNFTGNNCTTNNGGGAIGACKVTTEPNIYVTGSRFVNNINTCTQIGGSSTTGVGRGGAISIMDDGTLKAYNNKFIGNDAVIGTAICAISQGSYGSPDVEIVGNNFTNQTSSIGSDLLIISLSNSHYLVENNTYSNNNISVGKFRLDIDDNNGLVTVNITLRLKHAEDYDSDIVTKSGFDVYVDNVYNKTVYDTTFTLNFADSVNHNVKVVPLCLAGVSASKNINDANYNTIYVSTTGSDNNNGTSRDYAVRTISKAIELASTVDYIKILEGTYYERGLTVSNVTIEGEGNVVLDGSASSANTFIVDASVIFKNLQFTGIASNSAISITSETGNDYLITVSNCSFYSNNVAAKLINAKDLNIEDSTIYDNVVQYAIYSTGNLIMDNCNVYGNSLRNPASSSVYSIVYISNGLISNSTFTNNNGKVGIVRINGNNVTIQESKFLNNHVIYNTAGDGGAIYGTAADNINIISSIFYNNSARRYGGAIYLSNKVSNLNITNSILIGNTANNRNYQIDRPNNPTTNIFAINNWWGNTIDNAYDAPTFYSNSNVNASIWLILNVTSNVTSLASGESALVTFDLTYTNILGSDSNDTSVVGNLTPFCIDGVYLPILEGILTATNGNVNVTNVSLVDGKISVLFTATGTDSYLTINILGISETIYFDENRLFLSEINDMSMDNINLSEMSVSKQYSDDLLGYGVNPDEWTDSRLMADVMILVYNNCCIIIPSIVDFGAWYDEDSFYNWADDDDQESWQEHWEELFEIEKNTHFNISFYNSTSDTWVNVIETSLIIPFPGYVDRLYFVPKSICIFNFTKGLYKFSILYDGQDMQYQYYDDKGELVDETYHYDSFSAEMEIDFSDEFYESEINLNPIVSFENSKININPQISTNVISGGDFSWSQYILDEDDPDFDEDYANKVYVNGICNTQYLFDGHAIVDENSDWYVNDSAYDPDDFPVVKPVNITMTITQGDKVIGNPFSVAPGSTYSLEGLAAGEYNLTAVYDDPYYGYATKTVSLTVNKNIWENTGADEGYSHCTDYSGPKNVEPLWNLSVNSFQGPVIDSEGNIYIANGTNIIALDSEGNFIKTIASDGFDSYGLALWGEVIFESVSLYDENSQLYRIYSSIPVEYKYIEGTVENGENSRSYYVPVVSNNKIYFVSNDFDYGANTYGNIDHLTVYDPTIRVGTVNGNTPYYGLTKHSAMFAGATGAPSIDSEGYIYVNTKSGLVILDPNLNILETSFGDAGKYGRPVIDSADMVYVFNADRTKVYALNRENGLEWNTTIADGACGVMAVDVENNALYIVGNDGILYKLNRGNGEMSELYNLGTNASSILVDARGTIYLGGTDGVLYAVTNEGKLLFKYNIGGTITKDMVLDDNGTLYLYANGKFYALGGAPKLYSEITINVSDVEVNRNNTIVATLPEDAQGNVIFIIDDTITSENIEIIDGNATWTAPGLLSGPHTVKVTWDGDSEYFGSEATEEFNAYKVNSTIDLEDSINYVGKLTQLNITLPSDANGTVNVVFNRKTETVEIVNGIATFETTPLEAGNYTIDFSWDGDDRYFGNSSYAYFTVIKNDATLTIDADPIREGEDLKVTVTVSDDESGVILISVGDINDFAQINDGKAEFTISGLAADTYDINVTYLGDNKYYNTTETSQVTVSPKDETPISINPEVIVNDDESSVEVTLPDDATGYVLVDVNGTVFYAEVNGGKVNVPVSGLKANTTYPVSVTYSGDDNYSSATKEGEITTPAEEIIEPKDPELKAAAQNSTVSVSVNKDATGSVVVDVDGTSYYAEIENGQAVIDIKGLEAGKDYVATVVYSGDENFTNASETVDISIPAEPVVEPKDPELKAVAQNSTVSVSVNKDATGSVVVDVDGTSYYAEIENGQAVIDIKGLEAGKDYVATVVYSGDENFTNASETVDISIPAEPVVELKDPNLKLDIKDTVVTVSIDPKATGDVIVTVGDISFVSDAQALAPIDVSKYLSNGTYSVSVKYVGDDNFTDAAQIGGSVTVPEKDQPAQNETELVTPEMSVKVTNTTIEVTLPGDATGYVLADVNGQGYYAKVTNGKASIDIIGLDAGTYPVTVDYLGDDKYVNATKTASVTIPKDEEPAQNETEPVTPQMTVKVTDTTIEVTLPKDAAGNVLVDVDGKGYYAPVKDGKASIDVIGLDEGNYPATVTYTGDDKYANATKSASVTVPKEEDPTPEPVDSNAKVDIGEDAVNVELPKDATGYVLVDVDGKGYYAPVKDGKATVDLPELAAGNHTVTVTYTGDDKYKPANATKTVEVPDDVPDKTVMTEDLTKVEKGSGSFVANFTDAEGNPLANTKVTFEINGGTYTRTTNANGQATFAVNLVAGTYTMVTTNPVTKESATNTITVLPRFTEDSDLVKYFRNDSQYVLKVLDDDGNPVKAGEIVTYNINGVFYNRTTNATGHVKLNINLPPDTYIITAEYKGCKVAHTVKVLPTLTGSDITKKYGQAGAYEAKLVDGQGKAYANQKIEFNINGVMYQRTTNADGVAKLNINLQAGKYIITASYGQARISNTVTVTA